MGKKGLTAILSTFLSCFYIAIVVYLSFAVLHIDRTANYGAALIFEGIGFVLLACFVLGGIIFQPVKLGYFVPCVIATILYTVVLDVLNLVFVGVMPPVFFVLVNLIVLFLYCVVSIPMYIMGKR